MYGRMCDRLLLKVLHWVSSSIFVETVSVLMLRLLSQSRLGKGLMEDGHSCKVGRHERQDSSPPAMGYLLPIGHRPHILGATLHGVVVPLSKLSTSSQQPQLLRWLNTEASFVILLPETSNPGADLSGSLGNSLTNCQTCKLHVLRLVSRCLGLCFL